MTALCIRIEINYAPPINCYCKEENGSITCHGKYHLRHFLVSTFLILVCSLQIFFNEISIHDIWRELSPCACLSPVLVRFLLLQEERKTERKGEEACAKKKVGTTGCAVGSNTGGPVWAWRRVYEGRQGGDGRARSRSSVGHWDVARGRDECGSHLQSVPVGQENHLWARWMRTESATLK